jgi:uncharacterized UBP type Zn finger protein
MLRRVFLTNHNKMWIGRALLILGTLLAVHAGFLGFKGVVSKLLICGDPTDGELGSSALLAQYSGIINLSNTCYMNSIVQSLFAMRSFREKLLSAELKKGSIGQELQSLFQKLQKGSMTSVPIKPYGLTAVMEIDIDVQEDAEELLLRLLNGVEESCLVSEETKQRVFRPSNLVKFKTLQRIRCVEHDHVKEKQLSNFDLSVDFRGHSCLQDALDSHFGIEMLSGENRYKCSIHGLQEAEKTLRMAQFPEVLIIHLKRFSFDPQTLQMLKVRIPLSYALSMC